MGDIQHRSGVVLQCIFQNLFRDDIEVVGRLVEDQEVGIGEHQLGKGNSSALPAAQRVDRLENIVVCKQEGGQHISDFGVCQIRIRVGNLLENGLFHVEHLMLLIVVTDLYTASKCKRAGIRSDDFV